MSNLSKMMFVFLIIFSFQCNAKVRNPWRLELQNSTCNFTMKYNEGNTNLSFRGQFEPCDSVLDIFSHTISNRIALVDAPSERGGTAYITYIVDNSIHGLKLNYQGSEEDTLKYQIADDIITLSTKLEKISLQIQSNGSIKLKKRQTLQ